MNKEIKKISELEKLKLRKAGLQSEIDYCTQSLNNHIEYFQHHLGSLVLSTITAGISNKAEGFIQNFLPFLGKKEKTEVQGIGVNETPSKANAIFEKAIQMMPVIIGIAKPLLLRYIFKKIRQGFSGK